MKETKTFTEGKILKPLVLFALPVLLALFLQAMYGAVDLLVVGKFASSVDVSGGVHRLSADGDHHKPDQQLRYGNDNSSGAADRKAASEKRAERRSERPWCFLVSSL